MKVLPHNVLLLVVVVALGGLWSVLRPNVDGESSGESVLAGFRPESVAQVRIRSGASEDSAEEASGVVLERTESGWSIRERYGWSARSYPMDRLLAGLSQLRDLDLAGVEASSHTAFGVDQRGTHLELVSASGDVLAQLVQGRAIGAEEPDAAARAGTYLRVMPREEVYHGRGIALLGSHPEAWLETRLMEFEHEAVEGIVARGSGAAAPAAVTRTAGGWMKDGERVPDLLVDDVLNELDALHIADVVAAGAGPSMGLVPQSTWSLALTLGEDSLSLRLGGPDGLGHYYVQRSPDEPVGLVPAETALRLDGLMRRLFPAE